MKKIYYLIFSTLLLYGNQGKAQTNAKYNALHTSVANQMVAEGFQSISIKQEGTIFFLAYENRVYRNEVAAIKKIIQLVTPLIKEKATNLIIITQRQQIPVFSTTIVLADYLDFQEGNISLEQFISRLQITQKVEKINRKNWVVYDNNSGKYKLEFVIEPDLNLALGGHPDAIQHQFNLLPTANIYLWKGAKFKFQAILPISNELPIPEETFVRPGILSFYQEIRLPANLLVGVSAGYFTNYRYGTALDVTKYFFNGNLAIRGHLGYTGYASYPKRLGVDEPEKMWQYGDFDYTDYKIGIDYFIAKWNLKVGVDYGKGLYDKSIAQVHITQRFKECSFGLFGFKTTNGYNYGVHLAIPIFPKKYWKPKTISVRPASHLKYTYYTTQNYVSQYETGNDFLLDHQLFTPVLIRNLLAREKWN